MANPDRLSNGQTAGAVRTGWGRTDRHFDHERSARRTCCWKTRRRDPERVSCRTHSSLALQSTRAQLTRRQPLR